MGLLAPCFVPRAGSLYTMIVQGEGFCSLQVVFREGMVLDEIDTCIRSRLNCRISSVIKTLPSQICDYEIVGLTKLPC